MLKLLAPSGVSSLIEKFKQQFPNLGIAEIFSDSEPTVQTKLGTKVPIGSVLSYQLSLTEGNIQVFTNISAVSRPLIESLRSTTRYTRRPEQYFSLIINGDNLITLF